MMESNGTNHEQNLFKGDVISEDIKYSFLFLGGILVGNGIFGNIIIIITLFTSKKLRSIHNIFIGNLAAADLIIESYFAVFFMADIATGYHPVVNMTNCVINGYIVVVCYNCSLWTLVSISFNRYLHICHNQIFKTLFTDTRTKGHLIIVWLVSGLMSMPPLIGWGRYSYDSKSHYCGFDRFSSRSYTLMVATASVGAPCVLVCYFNIAIFRYVRLAGKRVQVWSTAPQKGVSKSDIALMKSLFVVFVCLAVFMSPYMLSLLIDTQNTWSSAAHVACTFTSILNSSINWLLYGLMNNHFRQGYLQLLNRFLAAIKLKITVKSAINVDKDDAQDTAMGSTC